MTMALPVIPTVDGVPFPAGHVVTGDEMNALAYACTFAMNRPFSRVHATTTQVIPTFPGFMNYDTVDQDPDGMFSISNPGRLTIQTPGYYKVRYMCNLGSVGGNAFARVTTGPNNPVGNAVTSSTAPYSQWGAYTLGTASGGACGASGILNQYLFAGDIVQILAGRPAGTMTTITTNVGSWFSLEWVSI